MNVAFRPRFTLVYYICLIYAQALSTSQRIYKKLTGSEGVTECQKPHTFTRKCQSHFPSIKDNTIFKQDMFRTYYGYRQLRVKLQQN